MIVSKNIEVKEEILDMLESSVLEFTYKKKIDNLFRENKKLIERTSSKKKNKRQEDKGMGELITIANMNMDKFSKSNQESKEKPEKTEHTETLT